MGLGIMGTMEMARNAMRVARSGAEVSGNNLANASNPIYARQRIKIDSAVTIPTEKGPQGSGAAVARIEQIRDSVLDASIVYENSITGYHEGKQLYLRRAETALGQTIDNQSIDAGGAYGTYGLSEGMTELFNSFQSLSVSPTSIPERQTVISSAKKIASKLRTVDERLNRLRSALNEEVKDTINQVNSKIKEVAYIAINIGNIEVVEGSANEVRDSLQSALEQLSKYADIATTTNDNGELSLFLNGHEMITDNVMTNSVQLTEDSVTGMYYMSELNHGNKIDPEVGYIKGMIDVRDESVKDLRDKIDTLASQLITEVNALHQTGYDLDGVNDSKEHAVRLASLLAGRMALLNLIPYNRVAGLPYQTPARETIDPFVAILENRGINIQLRRRKGSRIDAACGQLRRGGQEESTESASLKP